MDARYLRIRRVDQCTEYNCKGRLVFDGVIEQNESEYKVCAHCDICHRGYTFTRKLQVRNDVES